MKWTALEMFQRAQLDAHQPMHCGEDCTFAVAMHTDSKTLWQRVQSGDQAALKVIFDDHYSALCRYAMQWTKDPDDAEEIVQRLFVDMWSKRESLEITITIKSYLFTATRNRCLNHLKHQKVVQLHKREASHEGRISYSLDHADELDRAINKAIAQLPEQCRNVFHKVKMEGKKYNEVAAELNISTKTIENHMTKALRMMRDALRDYLPAVIAMAISLSNKWMN